MKQYGLRAELWMRSIARLHSTVVERLAFNVKVATVLGSIPASSDTVESEGQMKQMLNNVHKKKKENISLLYLLYIFLQI
jgi:hypothetical protein